MSPKKARKNLRKIEVPTDTPPECELGDTTVDIQRRRQGRKQRERGRRQRKKQRGGGRRILNWKLFHEWKRLWLRNESEMDTVGWRRDQPNIY